MTDPIPTMKAVFIEDFGGPEQLKIGQMNVPWPGPGEVQIKIYHAAVNPVDWKIRMGFLRDRLPHHFPLIPGWDVAGVISALGPDVTELKLGDPVFAYCRKSIVQGGSYAEYICYPAKETALKPSTLSFAQAAAIPLAGLTAWQSLFDAAGLKKGESILIQAGAGGVGSLAIQFAKYAGATVITTARASNHAYVRSLGADCVIDYQENSLQEEVKKFAPHGIDVVLDTLGGQALKESFALLKPEGRLVSIVEPPDEALAHQYFIQSFFVFVSPNGQQLRQIANLLEEGKVKPVQIQEMPLESAAEAQMLSQQGHVQGKIVLRVQQEND